MTLTKRQVARQVAEARQRDVGSGRLRIDNRTISVLEATPGDFVEVIGFELGTVSTVWPAYAEDQGTGIVRMDTILQRNAGAAIGDYVLLSPVVIEEGTSIVFGPIGVTVRRMSMISVNSVTKYLDNRPLLQERSRGSVSGSKPPSFSRSWNYSPMEQSRSVRKRKYKSSVSLTRVLTPQSNRRMHKKLLQINH